MRLFRGKRAHPGMVVVTDPAVARVLDSPLNDPVLVAEAEASARVAGSSLARMLASGITPGRLSHFFDPAFYLARNPDVAAAGVDPYLHFLSSGLAEERDPHALVDLRYMRSQLAPGGAFPHWDDASLSRALRDGRTNPNPCFDVAYYLDCNPDVRDAGWPALQHFIQFGGNEGRPPSADFVPEWYVANNPGVPEGLYAAFEHFVVQGHAAGLASRPGLVSTMPAGSSVEVGLPDPAAGRDTAADAVAYQGTFDGIRDHVAFGWARHPDAPGTLVEVEILAGDRIVGLGRADLYRPDLEAAGYEDGRHAFGIPLSRLLLDGASHELRARVRGPGDAWLVGSRNVQADDPALAAFDVIPSDVVAGMAVAALPGADAAPLRERIIRAGLQLELGEWQAAETELADIAACIPDAPLLASMRAQAWMGLGAANRALQACVATDDSVGTLDAWRALDTGNAHRLLGQWPEAERAYLDGLERSPGHAYLMRRLAQVHRRQQLADIRALLVDRQSAQALRALAPLLMENPRDMALQQLTIEASRGLRGMPVSMNSEFAAACDALDLLEAVVDFVEAGRASP